MPLKWATAALAGAVAVAGCTAGRATLAGRVTTTAAAPRLEACEAGSAAVPSAGGLPDERLPCLVGSTRVRVASLHGRPAVVNLWASWCEPCRREMPALQAAHQRWGSRVRFLGIDVRDEREAALRFLADLGVTYPQVVDVDGRLPAKLGSPGLPVTLVLDAVAAVVWRRVGELDPTELERAVARAATGAGGQTAGSGQ